MPWRAGDSGVCEARLPAAAAAAEQRDESGGCVVAWRRVGLVWVYCPPRSAREPEGMTRGRARGGGSTCWFRADLGGVARIARHEVGRS